MRRPRPTEESRARAARIARALAGLLPDELEASPTASAGEVAVRGGDCPGCGATLYASGAAHGVEIDACTGCGGMWLDVGELEILTAGLDPAEGATSEAELRQRVARPRLRDEEIRYRECPRCREVMLRRNFGVISGVIVDECARHGVFLDAGELEAIEAFLRAGGRALGDAARASARARMMPPAPEPLPSPARVRARERAAGDVLWDLLFRW